MTHDRVPSVACIGAGAWGGNLIRNFHEIGALAVVCDQNEHLAAELGTRYPDVDFTTDFSEVLERPDIDAVCIATPAETHGKLVREALSRGKDVFVEKPLCLTALEGEALADLAEANGRILMVGHLLWYHPAVRKLAEMIRTGALGRIQYIYSNRLNLGRIRREENILWSFAPHDVSVILGLLDEMPERVSAFGGNYLQGRIADVTVSHMEFASGVKAHIFVSWLHPFKEQKLVVVGDKAMAVFNDVEKERKLTLYPHSIEWKNHVPIATKAEGEVVEHASAEPLREECLHFLACVRDRARPRTDGREATRVLEVLESSQHALNLAGGAGAPPSRNGGPEEGRGYFVHESSYVDPEVEIGRGTKIWHFCHVLGNTTIGEDCSVGQNVVIGPHVRVGNGVKIQNNVSVYQGVTLEDHVFCGPSMVFTNVVNPRSEIRRMSEVKETLVRRGASLGANCTIVCGNVIGEYAFVGAGAVVIHDVPSHALVVGNPARVVGWMCRCGNRVPVGDTGQPVVCSACASSYRRVEDASGTRLVEVQGGD